MHFFDIQITNPKELSKRAYLTISIEGKKIKEYNGNRIHVNIKPNLSKTIQERKLLLKSLEFEYRTRLQNGTYYSLITNSSVQSSSKKSVKELLEGALAYKSEMGLSKGYLTSLHGVHNQFLSFLTEKELSGNIYTLTRKRIQLFLSQFQSSSTYYMDRRRKLGVLFSCISKELESSLLQVKFTDCKKSNPILHQVYDQEQMLAVLSFLKEKNINLYLCCLLSYGCFLRPHREIRCLRKRHFKKNFTEIHLSAEENKSGKIRIVNVPDYIQLELKSRLQSMSEHDNLFTLEDSIPNEYYFSTAWTRVFKLMKVKDLVKQNQTIYSFRHTAAVNVYKKTKDLHILQQLLGHSDMIVTLKYLRGLGVHNTEELRSVMPEL